jgi:hypothetical protein
MAPNHSTRCAARKPGLRAVAWFCLAAAACPSSSPVWGALSHSGEIAHTSATFVQDDSNTDEPEVSPAEVEQYVAVYKAMQHDRSLTAEQAAGHQGLSLEAFRELESRVERDGAAMQRARDELQASAIQVTPAPRGPSSSSPR